MPPFKDLTGQSFGKLTVLHRVPHRRVAWLCRCVCGNTTTVTGDTMQQGKTSSCGCWRREQSKRNREKPKPQPGERFGRLVIHEFIGSDSRHPRVRCLCDCGKWCEPHWGNVKRGVTQSCGCLHNEQLSKRAKTHGLTKTIEYRIWADMISRCERPTATGYKDYGDRGIGVCQTWRQSFVAFLADVGQRPSPLHSIDRINNDGNYEPGNVRWATKSEQRLNQRRMCN